MNNDKEFNETVAKFEPMLDFPMDAIDVANLQTNAIVSIAISLKRIADKLEIASKQPIMMNSDDYAEYMRGQK